MENHNLSVVYSIKNKTVYILYAHLLFVLFLQTIKYVFYVLHSKNLLQKNN